MMGVTYIYSGIMNIYLNMIYWYIYIEDVRSQYVIYTYVYVYHILHHIIPTCDNYINMLDMLDMVYDIESYDNDISLRWLNMNMLDIIYWYSGIWYGWYS